MSDPPGSPFAAWIAWYRGRPRQSYWLTRFLILRLLGLVYLVGFLILAFQGPALIGSRGLLPAGLFLEKATRHFGGALDGFLHYPSIFWWNATDPFLLATAWVGAGLSAVVIAGYANSVILLVLWALYMSFIHIGQDWYGYGWEIQLLETGLLAVFLVPFWDARPFPRRPPPAVVIGLFRWLIVRIMLGAGLIKLRGDGCWRDLTCLDTHYETQPNPNPVSLFLHHLPHRFHAAGVAINHVVELGAPWFAFGPRLARHIAGALFVGFQLTLILTGNLSFLNWLTIVPAIACFDDGLLRRLLPRALSARAEAAAAVAAPSRARTFATFGFALLVVVLSLRPIGNLLSDHQAMNTSFDRLHLVNTYGAFGSVGEIRHEIVFEGTRAAAPTDDAPWREYEFKCKPGDPWRRPCVITPYHYRLDWQIWFAAMSRPERYPWTLHLVWKLLHDDAVVLGLLAGNPFPEGPPRYIRARYYRYEFAPPDDPEGRWWIRTPVGDWIPALAADDPRLIRFLQAYGWLEWERRVAAP